MKALSNLAQSVRASTTLAIDTQFNKMRSEGIDVIGFSVGQPDFPTPEHIKQAGIRLRGSFLPLYESHRKKFFRNRKFFAIIYCKSASFSL